MVAVEPFNAKHLKGGEENIWNKKRNEKQKILKKMPGPVVEFKRRIGYLFQRKKNNQQTNDDVVGVNVEQLV